MFSCLPEIPRAARGRVDDNVWAYFNGGTESETALRRNRHALDRLALKPRVLRDTTRIDPTAVLLGKRVAMPLMMAPIGSLQTITAGGSADTFRGIDRAGVIGIVGSASQPALEIAAAASAGAGGGRTWYQLYVHGDAGWVDDVVARVDAAGYEALIFTVDLDYYSIREKQILLGYIPPSQSDPSLNAFRAGFTWADLARIRDRWRRSLIVKGIQTAEDAEIAVQHGVDAVYVSNHGGRALDHARAAMDILPEIVTAVGGRAEIYVDGGCLRATDMLKAMALGADAVGLGRLHAWALAAGGGRPERSGRDARTFPPRTRHLDGPARHHLARRTRTAIRNDRTTPVGDRHVQCLSVSRPVDGSVALRGQTLSTSQMITPGRPTQAARLASGNFSMACVMADWSVRRGS